MSHLYYRQQRCDVAELIVMETLEKARKLFAPDDPIILDLLKELERLYQRQRKDVESIYRNILDIWGREPVKEPRVVANALYDLALNYQGRGKYAEAAVMCKRAVAVLEKVNCQDYWLMEETIKLMVGCYFDLEKVTGDQAYGDKAEQIIAKWVTRNIGIR